MKKITIVMMCLLVIPALAEKLNLANPLVVENFGANIIKNKLNSYDSVALGVWYLQNNYSSKWNRVRNDEFERDEAVTWAYEQWKTKLMKSIPIEKKSEYHLYLNSKFTKYDFKREVFPIQALSENSYMSYAGKGEYVQHYSSSKLSFENADEKINFVPMKKSQAKEFINSRKDRYGNIDRALTSHYTYIITRFVEDNEFTSNGSPMTIKFTAKLKSVEFMDKNRKHILHKVDFNDTVSVEPITNFHH